MVWDDRVWYPAMVWFTTERYGMVLYGIHISLLFQCHEIFKTQQSSASLNDGNDQQIYDKYSYKKKYSTKKYTSTDYKKKKNVKDVKKSSYGSGYKDTGELMANY